jgi:hypothetical protein
MTAMADTSADQDNVLIVLIAAACFAVMACSPTIESVNPPAPIRPVLADPFSHVIFHQC